MRHHLLLCDLHIDSVNGKLCIGCVFVLEKQKKKLQMATSKGMRLY